MEETLSFSEKVKGWTSFHSFIPDWFTRLNNRLFTIKDGQLYLHNDESNPIRNEFYGVSYPSKIVTEFNDSPSDDKIFKNIVEEGDRPWSVVLKTNLSEGTIAASEFNQRESRWFAYTRKSEKTDDIRGHAAQGIGALVSTAGLTVTFGYVNQLVSAGDVLFQLNAGVEEEIGVINDIVGNVVSVLAITTIPVPGYFCFAKKDQRIEGAEIRGYYMEVTLENAEPGDAELFAINTNAVKSHV
jgi:hypothetical protein